MCTLRHILPQGVKSTFNKATERGELKWINLLDATHANYEYVCVCGLGLAVNSETKAMSHFPFL